MRTYQTLTLVGCILGILLMIGLGILSTFVLNLSTSNDFGNPTSPDTKTQERITSMSNFSAGTAFSFLLYIACLVVAFVVRTKTKAVGITLLILGIITMAITNLWGIIPFAFLLPAGILALRYR